VSRALDVAAGIGGRLAGAAIWHEGRCNWIGALPEGPPWAPTVLHGSLPPDLYTGTAGVALVLAELHAATGEPELRRTALGAIRQALSCADHVPLGAALGLYSGRPGIAFAAELVGSLLVDEAAIEGAAALLGEVGTEDEGERTDDLVLGRAGGIVALLALAPRMSDPGLVPRAADLGDELVAAARRDGDGLSWPSPGLEIDDHLTGLAHGASGPGLALLELHRATGEERFRDAALSAFAYERGLFDPVAANWPDLRTRPITGGPRPVRRFTTAWCYGAPGIALARLRAAELIDDPTCRAEATAALETTAAVVREALAFDHRDFTLCHGLSGLAEVLSAGVALDGGGGDALAAAVADAGIERYAEPDREWPCGIPGGETQGLMVGLAGIALFYLRRHDPAVPSPLAVRPPG
jgi:lantibiotic biosynthesis protein